MKSLSIGSIVFVLIGILFYLAKEFAGDNSKPLILSGLMFLLMGAVLSFFAILSKEIGLIKFASLIACLTVFFFVSWYEPFEVLRVITWVKNSL